MKKKLWSAAAVAAALFPLILGLLPFLFRDRIEASVKAAIASKVNARVDWKRVSLSAIQHFPNLTLRLDGLTVVGVAPFQADTLVSMNRFRLVLDLVSVVRSVTGGAPIVVRGIELDRPAARLIVLQDGTANWDIMKPSPPSTSASRPLQLSLKRFELRDGRVTYDDRHAGLNASLANLRESLRGDFSAQRFTLESHTASDTVWVKFAGVPYLSGVTIGVDADLDVDMASRRFAVRQNEVRVNGLKATMKGTVAGGPDSTYALDLSFGAPGTSFKEILSLVPAIYARDFDKLQASGTMALAGWVRGTYGPKSFPAFSTDVRVRDGAFRYPDLPLPAREILLDLTLANPGGSVDRTTVDLRRGHIVIGANPVDALMVVRTPVSDPEVALRVTGKVDLADVARTVKLPTVEQLTGVVAGDATMHARMSDVDAKRYDRIGAAGTIRATGLVLKAKDVPHAVQVNDALLKLSPQAAELASFDARIGNSDVKATGSLENVLAYALGRQDLRGKATVSSGFFDLNEWRSDDKLQAVMVPRGIDFALQASAARVAYGKLELHNAQGAVHVKDGRATLENFRMDALGGALTLTGFYETTNPAKPTFDLQMKAADLNVPAAFGGLETVQMFVPVGRYAQGKASADLRLAGALGQDMVPVATVLTAIGSLKTAGIVLQQFPPMDKLAELLKTDQLKSPGFQDLSASFQIKDGRLFVKPFTTRVGQLGMTVSGSNGIDQSLAYNLALALPRAALGAEANRAVTSLLARTAKAGIDVKTSDVVNLAVQLGGTITNPTLSTNAADVAGSVASQVTGAVREAAQRKVDTLTQRVDAAAAAAKLRAQEQANQLIADAEQKAAAIRAGARTLADSVRSQAQMRADSLANRPTSALGKLAAKAAADRVKKEADSRAQAIVKGADARADSLVAGARRKASALTGQ